MTILRAASSSSTSSSTRKGRQRRHVKAVSPFSLSPAVLLLLRSTSAQPKTVMCGNNGKWKNKDGCTYPLLECTGDCDTDKDCAGDLVCHQRDAYEAVPGCSRGEQDKSETDYCVRPSGGAGGDKQLVMASSSIISPTPSISASPTQLPTISSAPSTSAAPTFRPTQKPTINKSNPVRLRLYWKKGYRWQESSRETYWCMECDGSCSSGNKIEIKWCSSSDNKQKFQYYYDDSKFDFNTIHLTCHILIDWKWIVSTSSNTVFQTFYRDLPSKESSWSLLYWERIWFKV